MINSIYYLDEVSEESLNSAIKKQEELVMNAPKTRADVSELYSIAMENYVAGIKIVKAKGATHTAEYMDMEHAIVPREKILSSWKPITFCHKGDA